MILYHGSNLEVKEPKLIVGRFTKDFGVGFYCTTLEKQAKRWACRHTGIGVISLYDYTPNPNLNVKIFETMTEEWLDFIIACRQGIHHSYDIVEGPMADDVIFNYINDYINEEITREAFWALAKFRYPTHQICFCSNKALKCLNYLNSSEVNIC